MNPSPDPAHETLREQLGSYVLGQLDADERATLETHLRGCASCRAERDEIAPVARPLARVDPDGPWDATPSEPSAAGFAGILGRLHDEQSLDAPTTRTGPVPTAPADGADATVVPLAPRRRAMSPWLVAAAAVLVALAGLGVGFVLGAGTGGPSPEPAAVQALDPAVQASAGAIPHTWGVEVVLTGTGFAPGQVYEAAVVTRDGRRVEAGAFLGTGAAEMECRLNSSVRREQVSGFVVTDAAGAEVLRSRLA